MTEPLNAHTAERVNNLHHKVLEGRPTIAKVERLYGAMSLKDYGEQLWNNNVEPIQPHDDFSRSLHEHTAKIYGDEVADAVVTQTESTRTFVSAHHHGVDSLGITLNCSLNTAVGLPQDGTATQLVLATGRVPLGNLAFGAGLLFARTYEHTTREGQTRHVPYKLRVFPDRMEEVMVALAPAFQLPQVQNAQKRAQQLFQKGEISNAEFNAAQRILSEYTKPDVLAMDTYSDQASRINGRLWNDVLFHADYKQSAPNLVFLESEKILKDLVALDLRNDTSVLYRMMFDESLLQHAMQTLNGAYGCWNMQGGEMKGGTHFFWGVDPQKKDEFPLQIAHDGSQLVLRGADTKHSEFSVPYNADGLQTAMEQTHIVPSLLPYFTCYTFARGLNPIGGFNQLDYLGRMQRGVVEALQQTGNPQYQEWAQNIDHAPTLSFGAGMFVIAAQYANGDIRPASLIEIAAYGGLRAEDIDRMSKLTVQDAIMLGLPSTYSTITTPETRDNDLATLTESDIYATGLKEKVVTITL